MNTINEFCYRILQSGNLEDKLSPPPESLIDATVTSCDIPCLPARSEKIRFSDEKSKIPRLEHLNKEINRGITLHHFANHELMAIELFAFAILKFQNAPRSFRRGFLRSLCDEQKHMKLYLKRMQELGVEFGDKPLNYIFWKQIPKMPSIEKFCAIMSVSFEGANLDYSLIYKETFAELGDLESSKIMDTVYRDEIKHVKRGLHVLRHSNNENQNDWNYYLSLLEKPFTPRRAKGYYYIPDSRKQVGFDKFFIEGLGEYRDEFSIRKKEVLPDKLINKI
ncbi:MAG: ferritin-like domain-containing protein [Leptospira sp.]|nr:ferritin-like domain-containing protein [Leptospira sp.]